MSEPGQITRREMLTLVGGSLSLAGLAGCRRPVERIVPFVSAPEDVIPGIPRYYATTMPFSQSAYGLLVETHDGHPTKIEGNRLHPSTRGTSSAWMQASILGLYDPDRSSSLRRAGEPAAWDGFVAFWNELHAGLVESGGAGLAVLAEPDASPTLSRLRARLHDVFPEARWVTYEPVSEDNVHRGLELATGRAYRPRYRFAEAATVLALDSDFLLSDPESVAYARDFAEARRVTSVSDAMNRLYVAESGYSVTGAMADHRLRMPSGEIYAWLVALATELADRGLEVESPASLPGTTFERRWIEIVAQDLLDQRRRGVIVTGPGQPAPVHALAFALNTALGNVGRTVTYYPLDDEERTDRRRLGDLAQAMRTQDVSTLIVLGGNPVYNAPADVEFAEALSRVEHSIHLASHLDETSRSCTWHIPRAHFLEAWGDCRALDGTLSVTQPVVQPLLGGRSDVELIALLESGGPRPAYDEVRATWRTILSEVEFERRWNRVLHDGLLRGSASAGESPRIRNGALPVAAVPVVGTDALEVVFRPSLAVHDGRFANVGWLQELPDPLTKMTWDNPALLSPQTMARLGLENEDLVRVRLAGRAVELPVWSVPGQADGSLILTLGYGRLAAGRIGDGVGFDAYGLRTLEEFDFVGNAEVDKLDRKHPLASTQDHGGMEGRPIVREATLEAYRRNPAFAPEAVDVPPLTQLFPDQPYDQGNQWGMSIDLNACTGCNACVIACQSENNIPVVGKEQVRNSREMHWLRLDRYFVSEAGQAPPESPAVRFQPMPCMHCENAPCEQVCPVGATVHNGEGLNVMVYNRCIGTRYCSNNCPYKVRRFNYFNFTRETPELVELAQNPDVTVRTRGVIEKCTYCTQRINAAKIEARLADRAVTDNDFQTACEQACPSGAIVFGDIRDPESRISASRASDRTYVLLEELNNRPRTTFQAKLRNPHPRRQDR